MVGCDGVPSHETTSSKPVIVPSGVESSGMIIIVDCWIVAVLVIVVDSGNDPARIFNVSRWTWNAASMGGGTSMEFVTQISPLSLTANVAPWEFFQSKTSASVAGSVVVIVSESSNVP